MKTKEIRQAAKTYKANRDKQNFEKWDKQKDQKAVFDAMRNAGLVGLSAMAGTHFGTNPNSKTKPLVVVDISEDDISIKSFKDVSDYWNSLTK